MNKFYKDFLKSNGIIAMVFSFLLFSFTAFGQNAVHGVVKNSQGEFLQGVSVSIKNSSAGTSTDEQGKYTLNAPNLQGRLRFTFTGFKTNEVAIAGRTSVDIMLETDVSKLDEVVVIGYGKQSRELITTSVAKLDTKVLENVPYANATSALQGTIPGLRVQSTSGQPGAAPRVILRGGTSINNPDGATPLYIIDGITRTNMNDISADDIESLQVLKDAAATSIYGSRGSNGVIIVSTKSGKAGRTRISYSYDVTSSNIGKTIEYANAKDYLEQSRLSIVATAKKDPSKLARLTLASATGTGNDLTKNTGYTTMYLTPANQYKLNEGWQSIPDPVDPTRILIFKETNYQDLIYRNAISNNHYLSASGGTEKATFNIGAGYLTSEGIAIATNYRRITLNFNSTLQVTKNLDVTGRLLYSNNKNQAVASLANTFFRVASTPGTTKFQFEDGTMAPGQNFSIGNPYYHFIGPFAPQGDNSLDNLTMAIASHWNILPGLTFDPQISLYKVTGDSYSFQPTSLRNGIGAPSTTRAASSSYSKLTQYEATGVLTYIKSFSRVHNLEAKAGGSYFGRENYSLSASGQGASTDLIPTLNASATPTNVGGSKSNLVIEGLFGRINYDFKAKYLISLNVRYDGSSNLGSENKFGFFPGISAGWNLHQENFWKMFPKDLITLKLRGSYGVNGNISGLTDFQPQGSYDVNNQYAGNAAVVGSIIPNPDLQWEESKTTDVGFDLGLFERRVHVLFDYYDKVTDNLLTTVSLPSSSGYVNTLTNLGSLGSKGMELELNVQALPGSSPLQWNLSFNAAHVKTQILKLPSNGIEYNRVGGVLLYDPNTKGYRYFGGLQEGGRIGDLFNYRQLGVYATDEEAVKAPLDVLVPIDIGNPANGRKKYGGDVNFQDTDGNGTIDSRDQVFMGNIYPTWTGGFSNYLTYKNIGLLARFDFTTGHTIYNYPRVFADGQLQGDALPTQEFLDNSWKKQGDITNTPRYLWQNQQQNTGRSSMYYEKGDFLCLREITLSYSVPADIFRRIKISNLRVNLTGNNLRYFTKFKGLNPEEGSAQDNGHYPIPRNFILGVNIAL